MTTIQLYDPATLAGLLGTKTTDGYLDPVIRGIVPDSTRDDQLRAIQASPLGSHRSLAIGTPDILERLDTLLSIAPHFADALGIIRRAAVLSMHANSGLAIPPILLLGPPGVGKTFVARRIANALGVPMAEYSFASGDDPGALTGHSLSWRAARPGLVAKLLLEEDCANPLLFIDEVDKASSWRDDDPTDCLHALLEPENAARFADQFLELPLRADNIVWILTANDVAHLRPSLLDRMVVVSIKEPTPEQQIAVIRSIYDAAVAPYAFVLDHEPDGPVLARLGTLPPRKMRRVLQLAVPYALADGRKRLNPSDIDSAVRLVSPAPTRRPIGFPLGKRV